MSPELSKVLRKQPVRRPGVGQAGGYQLKRDLRSRKSWQASGQACSRGAAHRATAPSRHRGMCKLPESGVSGGHQVRQSNDAQWALGAVPPPHTSPSLGKAQP